MVLGKKKEFWHVCKHKLNGTSDNLYYTVNI